MNLSPAQDGLIQLKQLSYQSLLELASADGINASGKDEIYGCIFGRDSAVTILKILKSISNAKKTNDLTHQETEHLLSICRNSLLKLTELQGRQTNIESGEEPGKFIHEFRRERFGHLLELETPWYVYPDGVVRNYDSIDSTPLGLIAIYRYWQQTHDGEFLLKVLPVVERGLNWIMMYGDRDRDFLLEYEIPKERKHGGLVVQSWTDSHESVSHKDGSMPLYPIAPVEAQGYAWLALRLWADYYNLPFARTGLRSKTFAKMLRAHAYHMKSAFNENFIYTSNGLHFAAQALDGHKQQIKTVTGNPLLLLWATYTKKGIRESILDDHFVYDIIKRSFMSDMFDPEAGIRTMSTLADTFDSSTNSYHNGSFWPKLNGMAHEGLMNWRYFDEADKLKIATLKPLLYFGTPIELYVKTHDGYSEWINATTGQTSCRVQAWSAAAALDLLTQ